MPRGVGLLEKSFCLVETILFSLHSLLLSTRLVWCYISSRLLLFFARASWRTHFALKKKGRKTKRKKNLPLSMGAALALECSLWPLLLLALTEQRARFINYRSRVTFFPSSSNSTPEAAGAIRTWSTRIIKFDLGEGKGKLPSSTRITAAALRNQSYSKPLSDLKSLFLSPRLFFLSSTNPL